MNKTLIISTFLMLLSALCWAGGNKDNSTNSAPQNQQQSLVQPVAPPAPVFWTGDGGKGISLAVLEPSNRGLSTDEQRWIPSTIQSSMTGDFQKYSAITVFDRQNLEIILSEQKNALSGDFSDEDYIRIGHLTNARYVLTGSLTKTATAYMLEFAVTDIGSGERRASRPPKAVTLFGLEDLSAIKEATAELLEQLGVNLTERGRQELLRATNTAHMQAEMALARGITAQRHGTVVEALSYFIQASNYDSGLVEAASRMNILSQNISSGNIGQDTRNDIAWRRQWIELLREAETFFANTIKEPQPFYIVYSTDIRHGNINYQRETIDLTIRLGFYPDFVWSNQINEVMRTVRNGLQATRRAEIWEIDWPAKAINTQSPFVNRTNNATSTVVVEIINEDGKNIGRQTVRSPYGFESRDSVITPLWQWEGDVTFPAVDANLITDRLIIKITTIDGVAAETAARQKRISIMPNAEWELFLRQNQISRQNIESARTRHRAIELVKQADEHFRTGNFERAITDYTEAIRINSNVATAFNGRGNAHSRRSNHSQAISDWERALQINPSIAEARQNIERTRNQQQREQEQLAQQQQREREQREQEQRQRAEALVAQGRRNFDIRDYNRAITEFTEAIRLNPNLSTAYFQRARAYSELRNYDRAIDDYTQNIRLNPNNDVSYNNRGTKYYEKNDYTRAISDYTQAIRLSPSDPEYYRNRGIAYSGLGNFRMVFADLNESIRLDPNDASAYNARGYAYSEIGEKNRAIADFETALRLNPNETIYRNNLRTVRGW